MTSAVITGPSFTIASPADVAAEVAKMHQIIHECNDTVIEQPGLVTGLWISEISRTNDLALGGPGVAKTFAIDITHAHMDDTIRKFSILCMKSTQAQEIFGHISPKQLVEFDRLVHQITGMMPDVHTSKVDEVFKLNSVAANGMLGMMNERTFKVNGHMVDIPLRCIHAASNMAEYKGNALATGDLAPFRDRFGAAWVIEPVKTSDGLLKILQGQHERHKADAKLPPNATTISLEEMDKLHAATMLVDVPQDVFAAMVDLIQRALGKGIEPSIRRYGLLMARMKASAVLNGRFDVRTSDLVLAKDMLWTELEERADARELVMPYAGQAMNRASMLRKTLEPLAKDLSEIQAKVDPATGRPPTEAFNKLGVLFQDNFTNVVEVAENEIANAQKLGEDVTELMGVLRDAEMVDTTLRGFMKLPPRTTT